MTAEIGIETSGRVARHRQARALRRSVPPRARVTERDRSFLLALARTRYLTTGLIAHLLFHGSRRIANRRARRLLDLGLIRCWVPSLNHDNIYGLTAAGRRLLGESGEDLPDAVQCPRNLDAQWQHELAINSVRLRLALDLERSNTELAWWRSNRELRAAARQASIPDALFAIEWSEGAEQIYALEVEYATRAPQSFLRKVARYTAAWYRAGGIYGVGHPVVLVVGRDPTWLERYRSATTRLAMPIVIGFTTLVEVEAEGPVGAVWRTPRGDEKVCLQSLGTCSYRNHTSVAETLDETCADGPRAAHIS